MDSPNHPDYPFPKPIRTKPTSSPRHPSSSLTPTATPTSGAHRKIAIAVDLSDESAHAVKWAVQHYLRPGDAVILLHVRPTSVLYGADWGSVDLSLYNNNNKKVELDDTDLDNAADVANEDEKQKLEDEFDNFTSTKATALAQPLVDGGIPFKIHIVKDHDMKERLCLEVERLGLSAVIMGSRGFGATKRSIKGRLGSVSDYCVHHCVCPVVVVRYPDEEKVGGSEKGTQVGSGVKTVRGEEVELHPVIEDEMEYHDASDEQKESPDATQKA